MELTMKKIHEFKRFNLMLSSMMDGDVVTFLQSLLCYLINSGRFLLASFSPRINASPHHLWIVTRKDESIQFPYAIKAGGQ
jgi:hypothetical protein